MYYVIPSPRLAELDVPFTDLGEADLVVDTVYAGGTLGHSGDDPIGKLLPGTGNQGGFRYVSPAGADQSPADTTAEKLRLLGREPV